MSGCSREASVEAEGLPTEDAKSLASRPRFGTDRRDSPLSNCGPAL